MLVTHQDHAQVVEVVVHGLEISYLLTVDTINVVFIQIFNFILFIVYFDYASWGSSYIWGWDDYCLSYNYWNGYDCLICSDNYYLCYDCNYDSYWGSWYDGCR